MHLNELRELLPVPELCVVINVDTEVVSALAVASAIKNADMPVLLVNCTDVETNRVMCRTLGEQWDVYTANVHLDVHGKTIDHLFRNLNAERILLLDSDAEIRSPHVMDRMRAALDRPDIFGSGWINDYFWLFPEPPVRPIWSLFVQRPFIPCALFKSNVIRWALSHERSFAERFVIGPQLHVYEEPPAGMMGEHEHIASTYDTGAEMMQFVQKYSPYRFEGPRGYPDPEEVFHYGGMTRSVLGGDNGWTMDDIEHDALTRLRAHYPELWEGFTTAVSAAAAAAELSRRDVDERRVIARGGETTP